ncbi:hypothetical protein EV702DRAFT_1197446 [Suillus placidus]|uniref:Uncharacterized protein n=1 Tax=Suillus placidus TaxID=48579 RepID=A0A9P7D2V8_9AGAM|nr:hypothetical protein EV702DRAFT_1197446 [Suillus placidus]
MADVKVLVAAAVNKECADEEGDFGIANTSNSKSRLSSLHKWLTCSHPLSYQDRAFEHLLCCIVLDPENHCGGLPKPSEQQLMIQDFSLHIINMTQSNKTTLQLLLPPSFPQHLDHFLQDVFSGLANHLHINHVPWHVANVGARGRCSFKPMHMSWINLGKPPETQTVGQRNAGPGINHAAEASKKA